MYNIKNRIGEDHTFSKKKNLPTKNTGHFSPAFSMHRQLKVKTNSQSISNVSRHFKTPRTALEQLSEISARSRDKSGVGVETRRDLAKAKVFRV